MPKFLDVTDQAAARAAIGALAAEDLDDLLPLFDARDYGVIADGEPHNNVANLLDCVASCVAAGGGTVLLPRGVIDTSDADLGTVDALSGISYTNNGGIPLPDQCPITIAGHGVGNSVLKLSTGFTRAFDFWCVESGQVHENIVLRDMTIDRNDLTGLDIGPTVTLAGSLTLPHGSWVSLPGAPAATTWRNCRLVSLPSSNAGTAKSLRMVARISDGVVQLQNQSGSSVTLNSGDKVEGAIWDHVIVGTAMFAESVPSGLDMTINNLTVQNIETINVPATPVSGLASHVRDNQENICIRVNKTVGSAITPKITNVTIRNVRMNGGNGGVFVGGREGTFIDNIWCVDCFHDTGRRETFNWLSSNFHFGQRAWVGTVGVARCHGAGSGDVGVEFNQPWNATEVDCTWEDCFSPVYFTSFVAPARTAAGPTTTTLASQLSSSATTASMVLPDTVNISGLALIDSELIWYQLSGGVMNITRAVNQTTSASHSSGATVTFVETYKTRIYSVRSTITSGAVRSTKGAAYCSYEQANLPIPPIAITDGTINFVGGKLGEGAAIFWLGWIPEFTLQGMRLNHLRISDPTAAAASYSEITWDWRGGAGLTSDNSTIPAPRVYGRNNIFTIDGDVAATAEFNAFRTGDGLAHVDFDITANISMRGPALGKIVVAKAAATNRPACLTRNSRIGSAVLPSTSTAPTAFEVTSATAAVPLTVELLDADVRHANPSDTGYQPFKINDTQTSNVRVNSPSWVASTKQGGTTADNGANTWAKLATFSPNGATLNLVLAVTMTNTVTANYGSAVIAVWANGEASPPSVNVEMLSKSGAGNIMPSDAFKIISGAAGSNIELWMRKNSNYGRFQVYELAKSVSGASGPGFLKYHTDAPWQANVPTGDVNNVSTAGPSTGGVPLATTTTVQTLTQKTLTSPTLTTPKISSGGAPSSAAATGAAGTIAWDDGFIYICTATNVWKRANLTTWP